VLYDGYVLKATRILYDGDTDRLIIEGPLSIVTSQGSFLLADSAEIAPDLANGVLYSARLVLEQQLQLAANSLHRVEGRYSVLNNTIATSCTVCGTEVPLWQIRASRVIHDEAERQLYFDNARFEVAGVPVFYLPRLRLPDPTLTRANGFLLPSIRASELLGFGVRAPYFVTIGPHADLTFTPYLSSKTRTLEARFRRAFRTGEIELNGAISDDDLTTGGLRGYIFSEGRFDLPRDFKLTFDIKAVGDDSYLSDYGISDADRLTSELAATRTKRDQNIRLEFVYFESLRTDESGATLPRSLIDTAWSHRFVPGLLGGIALAEVEFFAFNRPSGGDVVGRDVERATARLNWTRNWTAANGIVFGLTTAADLDYYSLRDDSTRPDTQLRTTRYIATELRWPLVRQTAGGATEILEPIVQLAWAGTDDKDIPNEDSLTAELDEGNLFAASRFPGADAVEEGLRATVAVNWSHFDPAGWSWGLTAGRILRADKVSQFDPGTGLAGYSSDWLASFKADTGRGFSIQNRALFDDDFSFSSNELRLNWQRDRLDLSSSYIWKEANLTESRSVNSSEIQFDGSYDFTRNWTGQLDWRYDLIAQRASYTGLSIGYKNECVEVDLSLSRRFTSSDNVEPTTDFGLSVQLAGFGSGGGRSYSRSCLNY